MRQTSEIVEGVGNVPLHVVTQGSGPLVLFVHGFPETSYSWRHQMEPVARAGFRAAAMDVRGYGRSGQPEAVEAYDMATMTGDVAAVIDALGDGSAIIVGHDWGAPIVWNTALLHPGRVRAVCGMSIPHLPVGEHTMLDIADMMFTQQGRFFYIAYFQEPGRAEAELERDPATTIRKLYWAWSGDAPKGTFHTNKPVDADMLSDIQPPDQLPEWISEADIAIYASSFEASGFRGALNRYRNFRRDHELLRALPSQVIRQPAMFMGGVVDPALRMFPFDPVEAMAPNFSDLRGSRLLDGIGHWIQQEAPDTVNDALLEFLSGI